MIFECSFQERKKNNNQKKPKERWCWCKNKTGIEKLTGRLTHTVSVLISVSRNVAALQTNRNVLPPRLEILHGVYIVTLFRLFG